MKSPFVSLALLLLAAGIGGADEELHSRYARFTLSTEHGHIVRAEAGRPILDPCLDLYLWQGEAGEVHSSEGDDQVVSVRRSPAGLTLVCRNRTLGEAITKQYALVDDGQALAKTVTVGPLSRRGELRVRSVVRLAEPYRAGAWMYTPRQSWTAPRDRDLFGVQPISRFTQEILSGSGWDNRFVVAFKEGAPALGHYRWAVRGRHVMPSAVTGAWGAQSAQALTATPTGWHFEMVHTLEGELSPVSATVHYLVTPGDFLEVWRRYRALPEHRAWEERPVPAWVTQCKVGGFWHISPGNDQSQVADAHAAAQRLDGYVPLGVFAWSLDGDYETERPFLNEGGNLILTPEYLQARLAEFQSDRRVRLGLYFQGSLIESRSSAYRKHPEWAIGTPEGQPFFSGFRDNPAGEMYFFNPLDSAWGNHYVSRLRAVCRTYQPGWIYCDGGAALETSDYRLRRPILPDDWDRFYRRQYEVVRRTGPERATLLNAQCWPHADLYWLECPYFSAGVPWREAVDFCFDTKILHTPQRTMLPLYWSDETRYLALCVAFGFTPCTSGRVGGWEERVWRAIGWAYAMRRASLILSSRAVSPRWWEGRSPVVCFAERVGDSIVVPVLNFGPSEKVRIVVNRAAAQVEGGAKAWLVRPFESAQPEPLARPSWRRGEATFELPVPPGFGGLRLLVLGKRGLLYPRQP